VLGAILAAAKSAHEDMQISLESKMLESGLSSLGKNAELAYRSGPGTILSSRLSIPYTAVEDGSYIGDGIINVRLEHKYGVRDVPYKLSVPVEGDLSFLPGDYEVFAVSHRNYVFITSTPTLVASDNIIYLKGRPGEEKRASVGIRNPGDTGTTYRAVLDPLPDDAGVTLEWHSKNVNGGGSTELGIRAEPGTSYSGDILVTSSTGEYERIRLEIGN